MKVFGVDVSKWQKGIDFSKVKAEGAKFVILRGAYSCPSVVSNGGKDSQFETFYKAAKAAGLNVGVYIYSMAQNTTQAKNEAVFLRENVLKGKQFELPIYFDIEDAVQKRLTKAQNTAICKAFLQNMPGYWVGIYSSKSFFTDHLNDSELQSWAHWVAQWSTQCTYSGKDGVLGMWQFGGETNLIRSTKVAGMTVDQNYMLIDYPTLIKKAGLNGFKKPVTKTPVELAIEKLHSKGVIASPEYWENNHGKLKYLDELLINMASKL